MSAEAIRGASAYHDLKAEWEELAARQPATTVFQAPAMLATWAEHFAADKDGALMTIVVRERGRAVLMWPLLIEKSALIRVAKAAGSPISQYDEILLDPACDAAEAFAAAMDVLKRSARPDVILLERVRADSALRSMLPDALPLGDAEGAPYADLSQGTAKLMASLKSRMARQQKKRMRRFDESGVVGFEIAEEPAQAARWLAEAMALKYEWLRSTGRISRAFVRSDTAECLEALARTRAPVASSPRMLVSRLSLDGRTAAMEMGFRQGSRYHMYLGAFEPEFAKLGPGNVLTGKLLEWCCANGIGRYDMMAPRSRNKGDWQSGEVEVFDFALPVTARGRFYVAGILRRLIPTMRRLFYRLPVPVRSALAGIALRNLSKAHRNAEEADQAMAG